jgi:3-hydroxybutyryl-CoA dehydratase
MSNITFHVGQKASTRKTITEADVVLYGSVSGDLNPLHTGTIYIKQTLAFKKPIFINDTVTTIVEILHIRDDKPIATLKNTIVNQNGEVVLEGESLVLLPEMQDRRHEG